MHLPRKHKAASTIRFPAAWTWFFDEFVPNWVKKNYSPKESWKSKPFSKDDARFFFKGIEELSELFTEERPRKLPAYFAHPRFRSAYLLYFMPLQTAKFLTLFQQHPSALAATLKHASRAGVLRVADLGAGPGTASIALLLFLMGLTAEEDMPSKIEFYWLDLNREVMEDGRKMLEEFVGSFPKLRGRVSVHLKETAWWKAAEILPGKMSLLLMGNLLNESVLPQNAHPWEGLLPLADGGGILMVEPAFKGASQKLSQLRDGLIEDGMIERKASSIWGPCLHAEKCPLGEGRDWCHFSVPASIPGQWFKKFSEGLGSERQWLKFSYVWFSSREFRAPMPDRNLRRVVSDPMKPVRAGQGNSPSVLLCEPEIPRRHPVKRGQQIWRGDLIKVVK